MAMVNNNPLTVIEEIWWLLQNIGWIPLNTYGASKQGIIVGCGGVFWKVWELVVHVVELCVIFLKWSFSLMLEYSFYSCNMERRNSDGWSLLQNIRKSEVRVWHPYHEVNKCADVLSNMVCSGGFPLILFI